MTSKYEKTIIQLVDTIGRVDENVQNLKEDAIPAINKHLCTINGRCEEHSKIIIQLTERSRDHTEDITELKEQAKNMAILNILKKKWFWVVVVIIILIALGGTGVIDVQTLLLQLLQ